MLGENRTSTREPLCRNLLEQDAIQGDPARGGLPGTREAAKQGGLACAVWAKDAEHLAGTDRDVHIQEEGTIADSNRHRL